MIHIGIPDMSSWDLLKKIKIKSSSRVLLVGDIPLSLNRIQSLKQDGFFTYLQGPFSLEELIKEIRGYLKL